jgi:phosphatidylglycerophosphatase A
LPFRHPAVLLATWFGAGCLPLAPGSWSSLAALFFAWAIRSLLGVGGLAAASAIVFGVGWWASATVAKSSPVEDPREVVIDEVAGQWLVLLPAPPDLATYGLAFLLFRIFDVWKPWPARWADRQVKGGLGIMLDDLFAAVYAGVLLAVLLTIGGASGVRS